MRVIVAGFPTTGTNYVYFALKHFGFKVYDCMDNYKYLKDDWMKIYKEGGTTEDFKRMFEGVDAVIEAPCSYFWDEIHKAFPEAKIILTVAENEEAWARRAEGAFISNSYAYFANLRFLSPTLMRVANFKRKFDCFVLGLEFNWFYPFPRAFDKVRYQMKYRRHNSHVYQIVPEEKRLVYKGSEGWEPLCEFLDIPVPSVPFPTAGTVDKILQEYHLTHPITIRIKYEMISFASLTFFIIAYGVFKRFDFRWLLKDFFRLCRVHLKLN